MGFHARLPEVSGQIEISKAHRFAPPHSSLSSSIRSGDRTGRSPYVHERIVKFLRSQRIITARLRVELVYFLLSIIAARCASVKEA